VTRLYEAATQAAFKQIYQVQGGMHNDTWFKGGKDYIYAIKDFIDKANDHKLKAENPNLRSPPSQQQYANQASANMPNQGGGANQGSQYRRVLNRNMVAQDDFS
jgi:hypothetical protein